jgi:hypothetical protein
MASKPRHTDPHKLRDAERIPLMVAMRIAGEPLDAIGKAVGLSRSRACEVLKRACEERAQLADESVETWRSLELERLEGLWRIAWGIAHNEAEKREDGKQGKRRPKPSPDRQLRAVATALKIMERRARLLGLDIDKSESMGDSSGAQLLATFAAEVMKVYPNAGDTGNGGEVERGEVHRDGEPGGMPGRPDKQLP